MNIGRVSQITSRSITTSSRQSCIRVLIAVIALLFAPPRFSSAANIAPLGDGILGVKAAVDNSPGTMLYQAGSLANINDDDPTTHVDNWSNGSDQGAGISFVGVVWPSLRYEQIGSLTLVLATFGDGGWFGPNGTGPGVGGTLTPDYLTQPTVQVSTNGGTTWNNLSVTSDYLTAFDGASIGGGLNPNPNPITATFLIDPPVTNINGLRIIGPNGGNAGPDANGFLGVSELTIEGTFTDSDADGMPDGWEQAHGLNPTVNDATGDPDSDGLGNLAEYQANTDPQKPDTDSDGYSDGVEAASGSDPKDANSVPGNLARDGTGILGTHDDLNNLDNPVSNAGTVANINDGNLGTRVDTWNGGGTDKQSFVGILWTAPQTNPVLRLEFTLATFVDGGWFGPNNKSPAPGEALNLTYLTEPKVQVTTDGGGTWNDAPADSDYLTVLNGHRIGGGAVPNPSSTTAIFVLDPPATNINGIRLIGNEGGIASGGFLGVFELKVYAKTDSDADGMDDDWERKHGLVVGVKDGAADPDADGLPNLQEYLGATDPQNPDTDGDSLKDGAEVTTHHTNPSSADTDADGLGDGAEINTYLSNPLIADTDGDGFPDGQEVQLGSDPNRADNSPANLALRSDATGILGTEESSGFDTVVANAGTVANINDGDLTTRVDTYNGASADTLSFVGIVWTNALIKPLVALELSLATFFDGGWFGNNNVGPGSGGSLSAAVDLLEPKVQVTTDGTVWTDVAATSDYLVAFDGHPLPAVDFGPPTSATALFRLTTPQAGIKGVRIIGSEGGTASGGFLGVFELTALNRATQPVSLLNPAVVSGQFRFEFDTKAGSSYDILYNTSMTDTTWQKLTTITGDGSRKPVTDPIGPGSRFYRVESK
jgi:hypothetical protein